MVDLDSIFKLTKLSKNGVELHNSLAMSVEYVVFTITDSMHKNVNFLHSSARLYLQKINLIHKIYNSRTFSNLV